MGIILGRSENWSRIGTTAPFSWNSFYHCKLYSWIDCSLETSENTNGKEVLDAGASDVFHIVHCSICSHLLGAAASKFGTRLCSLCNISFLGRTYLTFHTAGRKNHNCENNRDRDRISWCSLYIQQRFF